MNKNGWRWSTISSLIPGTIRILLISGEGKSVRRKCVEAPTLEEAMQEAEKFVSSIDTKENVMLEYDIVIEESIVKLKQEVNRWLRDGWKPQGGMYRETITTSFGEKGSRCYQAVIKEYGDKSRPEIVCLCGSTRFYEEYDRQMLKFTLEGKIVLTIGTHRASDVDLMRKEKHQMNSEIKEMLDNLHKRKIDLADNIFVINVGGYIGESTRSEIEYAEKLGKRIEYLESV